MRTCYCGEKFVSVDETCTTLVGYLRTEDHDHDDNCVSVTYRCASNHTETVSIRRTCPNPTCDWKGRETCFCHKGIKPEGYPRPSLWDTTGEIPDTKRCEHCRALELDGHKCDPKWDKRVPYRERRKLIRAEEEARGPQTYSWTLSDPPKEPLKVWSNPDWDLGKMKLTVREMVTSTADADSIPVNWKPEPGDVRFYITEDALEEFQILAEEMEAEKEKKGE